MDYRAKTAPAATLASRVRDALVDRILSGELPPGTRLKDSEVAARYGTSSTPAREALRLLALDGLVEILPYHGCVVRSVDVHELAEIFDVRIVLEGHAARLAAGRLTPAQLRELEALAWEHEDAIAARAPQRASDAARRFHQLVVEAGGNSLLTRLHVYLGNRVRLVRRVYLREATPATDGCCREIVQALQARDGERAEALLVAQIAAAKVRLCAALQARSPTKTGDD